MTSIVAFVLVLLAGNTAVFAAQSNSQASLDAAYSLQSAGQPAAAIAMTQSLIDAHAFGPFDTARALDLEGICYGDLGETEKAIHTLEEAQQLLGPNDSDELGAVLDNLGRIYASSGDLKTAMHLYDRAFRIAEALGNHYAMMRVANNQAAIALKKRDNREARKYLRRIDQEVKQAPALGNDALASIASMKGWMALNEGDTREALNEYQAALRLWTEVHGERHPLTAWGHLLVGRAQAKTGDLRGSAQNMRDGLAVLASTLGEKSQRYAAAEIAYAGVLEQMGDLVQAARLRLDAKEKQALLREQHCATCTASVMALH